MKYTVDAHTNAAVCWVANPRIGSMLFPYPPKIKQEKGIIMPAKKLKEYLEREHVPYTSIPHAETYTAQETAQAAHVPGSQLGKTVMIELDGHMAMVVVPATRTVVLQELREATGAARVRFAAEEQFKNLFPDCEVGAMPPFGNLYGMEVYVAPQLAADRDIAFNAGSHHEVIQMRFADFDRLVHPKVVCCTV